MDFDFCDQSLFTKEEWAKKWLKNRSKSFHVRCYSCQLYKSLDDTVRIAVMWMDFAIEAFAFKLCLQKMHFLIVWPVQEQVMQKRQKKHLLCSAGTCL